MGSGQGRDKTSKRRRLPRAVRIGIHILAAVFGSLVILFAVAAWRLSSGPVSLAFLAPYGKENFAEQHPDLRLDFDDVILTWEGWKDALDIRALEVRVTDTRGATVLAVPEASVVLSARALLRDELAFSRVDLIAPTINLVRTLDGEFAMGIGSEDGTAALLLGDLIAGAGGGQDDIERTLREIRVRNATLTIDDQIEERTWRADAVDVSLGMVEPGLAGSVALDLELGERPLHLEADYVYDDISANIALELHIRELWPGVLETLLPDLAPLAALELPVSGTLETTLDDNFAVGDVGFDLSGGAGRLNLPEIYENGLEVELMQARGVVSADFSTLRLDDVFLEFGGPNLTVSGLLTGDAESFTFNGDAAFLEVPVDQFVRFWPPTLGPNPQRWMASNMSGGHMPRLRVRIDISSDDLSGEGLPETAVQGDLDLIGVTVSYLDPLPKLYDASGHVDFDGDSLRLALHGGRVLDVIEIAEGDVEITGIGVAEVMTASVTLQGPITQQLELLDHPMLGFPSKFGIAPALTSGQAETYAAFHFPLLLAMPIEEIKVHGNSTIREFVVPDIKPGYDLSEAELYLELDNAGMDVVGPARLNGVPVYLTWRERFTAGSPFLTQIELVGSSDDTDRVALGVATDPYLSGRAPFVFQFTDIDRNLQQIHISLDATGAWLSSPELLWSKRPGRFGEIDVRIDLGPDQPVNVSALAVRTPDLNLLARGVLEPDFGALREASIDSLQMGLSHAMGTVKPALGGGFDIDLSAQVFDFRPFLDAFDAADDESGTPPFTLNATAERMILGSDARPHETEGNPLHLRMLSNVAMAVRHERDSWREVALDGLLPGGEPVSARLKPETGDVRRVTVTSADAGSVARVMGIYRNLVGGQLKLDATIHDDEPDHPMRGLIEIVDFRVVRAPALAQMLSFFSLFGMLDALSGEGIAFDQLTFPFVLIDDVVSTEATRMYGTSLGINFSGDLNLVTNTVDADGTLVPAYIINSLLGNIPILGDIFTGGEGGGIVAANFSVEGPMRDPEVSVNPISILTPGFLRDLFGEIAPHGAPSLARQAEPEPPQAGAALAVSARSRSGRNASGGWAPATT
jgi:hypothetical protein